MARGMLTDEVVALMKSLDFEGTVKELRLMPYLMVRLLDNDYPSNIDGEERSILSNWKARGWIVESSISSKTFVVTENLLDRIYKVLKVGYCSDVLEYTNHTDYVIFEGCDGSGKTSIMRGLWDDIDLHQYHISDRSFMSDLVYARKFKRKEIHGIPVKVYRDYKIHQTRNLPNLKVVLCTADADTLTERCIEKNDPLIEGKDRRKIFAELAEDDISFHKAVCEFCDWYSIPYKVINTAEMTLNDSIKQAKAFILGESNESTDNVQSGANSSI